jgi:hypothetical protein
MPRANRRRMFSRLTQPPLQQSATPSNKSLRRLGKLAGLLLAAKFEMRMVAPALVPSTGGNDDCATHSVSRGALFQRRTSILKRAFMLGGLAY